MNKLVCISFYLQYYQQKFVVQPSLHQWNKSQPGLSLPLFHLQFMHLVQLISKKPGIVQGLRSSTRESGQFPNQEFALQGPEPAKELPGLRRLFGIHWGRPAARSCPRLCCRKPRSIPNTPNTSGTAKLLLAWNSPKVINTAKLKSQLPMEGGHKMKQQEQDGSPGSAQNSHSHCSPSSLLETRLETTPGLPTTLPSSPATWKPTSSEMHFGHWQNRSWEKKKFRIPSEIKFLPVRGSMLRIRKGSREISH